MPDFLLPDLGEGLTEAVIINWLVKVGDEVTIDQPIVEVETAKAEVEVPVPFAGTVTALFGQPGESLAVGTPLISVGGEPSLLAKRVDPPGSPAVGFHEPGVVTPNGSTHQPASHQVAGQQGGDHQVASGNVLIGYGTSAAAPKRRYRAPRNRPGITTPTTAIDSPPAALTAHEQLPGVISPLVRRMAREYRIDLATIPVDKTGIVRRQDVEAEIRRIRQSEPAAPAVVQKSVPVVVDPDVQRIPITGIRRLIADKMSRSRREIPEATVWVDVDATEFLAAREMMNRNLPGNKVSILGLLSRFAILGLQTYRELNSRVDGDEIVVPSYVHLGFAAQTDRGLVVPVVRHAETQNARELSLAIGDRATAAKAGKLPPQDLTGSTFTVNNYGVFGVDGSAAIINHPEVAILGMGRIIDRPWAVDGQIVCRKVMQLSLSFDHRVCDGGVAGGFLRFVADCVESPIYALASI